jgi:hypothetical protein
MTVRSNLKEALHTDSVDPHELLSLLLAHFGHAESDHEGTIAFPKRASARLIIRVRKALISNVQPGPAFEDAEAVDLGAKIERSLLDEQPPKVATGIAFSTHPVLGYFRAPEDVFQIFPAPPEAPRPPYLLGDHPFLLEYRFSPSSDGQVSNYRRSRALSEWVWFMNATLRDHISLIGPRSRHIWGLAAEDLDATTEWLPRWVQEFYSIQGLMFISDHYRDAKSPAIDLVPEEVYYSRLGLSADPMVLPDSWSADIARLARVPAETRGRFLQAGHWLTAAHDMWDFHISSWYVAQVAAIETLAHKDTIRDPCPECGADRNPGPTRRFKDFLDQHAPGSGSRTELDDLYAVRSGLVHGGTLLSHDSPFGGGLLGFGEERSHMDRLYLAVGRSLISWLRAASSESRTR